MSGYVTTRFLGIALKSELQHPRHTFTGPRWTKVKVLELNFFTIVVTNGLSTQVIKLVLDKSFFILNPRWIFRVCF